MLRGTVLKNFVKFKERYFFDFSKIGNGPYIFVGASSTGKTAALELIRRCMDDKLNSSLTNRCSPNEIAYAFCEFYIDIPVYGSTVITGIIVEKTDIIKNEEDGAVGGLKKDSKNLKTEKKTKFHKIIIYSTKDEQVHGFSKRYLEKEDGSIVDDNKVVELSHCLLEWVLENEEEQQTKECYKIRIEELVVDSFVNQVLHKIESTEPVIGKGSSYNPGRELWEEMQKRFVGVLSMRGIGAFQWTKSDFIDNKYKSENYDTACSQAEIITTLMGNSLVDDEKEERILNVLTDPTKFHFRRNSECDVQHDNRELMSKASSAELRKEKQPVQIFVRQDEDAPEFLLLKTSVGVMEAKQFSLLMAHKSFKTICLEEPDRGMHPQMIERMKEVLYQESEDKTVIVVTHNPYFLDARSIENTFIFFKENFFACVKNIGGLLKSNPVRKFIEIEDLKRVLFSSHALFVEGKSDKIVLQSLIRHVFTTPDNNPEFLSFEIIPMGGKTIKEKIASFCKSINIKYGLILDRDAYMKTKNKKIIIVDYPSYHLRSNSLSLFKQEFFNLSKTLEREEKTFIWKDGSLEDFLLSCRWKQSDLTRVLEVQNALPITYHQLKKDIKRSLNDGLSVEQSEILAEIIKDFNGIKRLRKFLKSLA